MAQQTVRIRARVPKPARKALWLGWVGGLILRLVGSRRRDVTGAELKRHDYPMSTQRLGVRFTERVRNAFRLRWIREIF